MPESLFSAEDGIVTYFDCDENGGNITFRQQMDVEPFMEQAKARFNEGLVNTKSEFRSIGNFPYGAIAAWARLNGIPDWRDIFRRGNEPLLGRMVHDPDFSAFRTLPGDFRGSFKARS